MSINVTVNGNPVNIRKGRMVLSDLDQIKKNERDRRRRLRLEQSRQQSKEISNRLLERARNAAQKELSRLEKDGKCELKQMHDRKIMDMQQKYQEDMEDIGQAHLAATFQPDVDAIIEAEARRNRALAIERGREAAQKFKDAEVREDARLLQQERMKKVREKENSRAAAVVEKSKQSINKDEKILSEPYHHSDEAIIVIHGDNSKKTKITKSPSKKSPIKVVTKSNVKVVANHSKLKSHTGSSETRRKSKEKEQRRHFDSKNRVRTQELNSSTASRIATNPDSEADDSEETPAININIPSTKSSKYSRYNPQDYIHESMESSSSSVDGSNSSSSSSTGEDSSYFSDAADPPIIKKNPKNKTPEKSKVQLYDHNTRQKNAYERPAGIVQRIDFTNEPNAEDLAREVLESENANAELLKKRKTNADRRGQDALLREKIRRDYQNMMENLEHLARDERKLKASQIHEPPNLHMSPMRKKEMQKKRQRKMNRALEGILRASEDPPYTLTEKIVTLKPQDDHQQDLQFHPDASWQAPPFNTPTSPRSPERKDSFDELSREEQILELLQKVERQKRILLREFGAHLPPDVFTPRIVETKNPVQTPAPEIQVINMSTREENTQTKIEKVDKVNKVEKVKTKQSEIAVQTSSIENETAEDKGVQVELTQEPKVTTESTVVGDNNKKVDQVVDNQKSHPLEPIVKIVTPEIDDSSSGSSIITDLVINFDKKQVQVTPKRRKKGTLKLLRKSSPLNSKSRPVNHNKTTPTKKPKSAPVSRLPTPKKSPKVQQKQKEEFRTEIDGLTTIDSSTDNSQMYSTSKNESSSMGKVYIQTRSSKKTIRIRDASDTTSTSYASPPNPQAAALLNHGALTDMTPILELLDSRAIDALHVRKSQISPVSTPETPSPRTIKLPSNVPNPEKISKMLKFVDNTDEGEKRARQQINQQVTFDRRQLFQPSSTLKSPQKSMQTCNCKNPNCKMHFDETDNQALKNCPEIQKLYEELENVCAERIASLTDLIKKLRNEPKILSSGNDFSLISPPPPPSQDKTSFLQLSTSSIPRSLKDVRNLVENVEAINNQLAKTLQESRKIIAGEGIDLPKPPLDFSQIQKSPDISDLKSKESTSSSNDDNDDNEDDDDNDDDDPSEKLKPKILSQETVKLNLDKFRLFKSPSKIDLKSGETIGHEDIVEKISNEILQQSRSVDKSSGFVTLESFKEADSYLAMKDEFDFREFDSIEEQNDRNVLERRTSQSPKKKEDFIPILAGIPKTSRALPNNNRGRPPVTLTGGQYRSPAHELSTIVEFDTPDTAERSQVSVKTSPSKAKRSLTSDIASPSVSPSKKSTFKKSLELPNSNFPISKNSTNITKPSVHVAPLPSHRTPETTPKRSQIQKSPTQLFPGKSLLPRRETKTFDAFALPKKNENNYQSYSSVREMKKNDKFQIETLPRDENDASALNTNNNEFKKTSSTSSNSFSPLSGISEIVSTPSSDFLKCASSPEEMERTLKKFGLGWAITTLKKTREASALSSSSNSDVTPIMTARKIISPIKRHAENLYLYGLPDFSDVSSISVKEASKSTERAVLLKGRTSTPNMMHSNSDTTTTNSSCISLRDPNDSLIAPNLFLSHGKKNRGKQTKHH